MSDTNATTATKTVTTSPCMLCGNASAVELTVQEAEALASGAYIQDALSSRDAGFRELVISGTHPACWDEMFGSDEE